MHQSNLIVDEEWNVQYILDLEWAAVLPSAFAQPPSWLSNEAPDTIMSGTYNEQREAFMESYKQQESSLGSGGHITCSSAMIRNWELGTFWYILALQHPTALHAIFYNKIQPGFSREHGDDDEFYLKTYPYWTRGADDFLIQKVQQMKGYHARLREVFMPQ